ncbi:MAG: glycosyltransferase family A protein [Bryobacteraceae bacterium]
MLAFVVPLKSARLAQSWPLVGKLLTRTLRSVCAQTCPDWRVIVACHEIPDVEVDDPRIEFLQVDFAPPGPEHDQRRGDKWKKQRAAVWRSRDYGAAHVMFLDSDDCVSNRLAAHVVAHPGAHGWFLRRGYFYRDGSKTVRFERWRFHKWCGSSHIFRPRLLGETREQLDAFYLGHLVMAERFRGIGAPLQPLPFPGAVYNMSHGENFYNHGLNVWPTRLWPRLVCRVLYHRAITDSIRAEFGLYPLP